ncbi:hypothetical protein QQ212_004876, partial [Vibrio alginolyticus]|nr:hypothetical protein [Vibrio alginolyticus]
MMKKWINLVLVSMIATMPIAQSVAKTMSTEGQLTLSYSDGRAPTQGVEKVNEVLKTIGVRVSTVSLPEEAKPILEISKKRAITKEESEKLISLFSMHRGDLLDQIEKAGRLPEAHRGGFLSTSE